MPNVIKMDDAWRKQFASYVKKDSFLLALSKPQLQMLCAVADGVQWDRRMFPNQVEPDRWQGTEEALTRRGLVVRKPQGEIVKILNSSKKRPGEYAFLNLTPAGEKVVELLLVSGMFVQSDAGSAKRSRSRRRRA